METRHVAKRQKTDEWSSCMESVLFNSDSLFRIACYLPLDGFLNLALTCRRFGVGGDDSLSLIEESARRVIQDIATEEEMAELQCYDGENWLSKYNYLQSLRVPLAFNQLVGQGIQYVDGNRSRVSYHDTSSGWAKWATAFSNNTMMAGKHYVSFEAHHERRRLDVFLGVMRPGEAVQSAKGSPFSPSFFNHFTQRRGNRQYNNIVNCCMYYAYSGRCYSSDWGEGDSDGEGNFVTDTWDGMEELSSPYKVGMLLDLNEGTLSVYINGRKLGVMKRGLAGQYCWVVSFLGGGQVTMKRGSVPAN